MNNIGSIEKQKTNASPIIILIRFMNFFCTQYICHLVNLKEWQLDNNSATFRNIQSSRICHIQYELV